MARIFSLSLLFFLLTAGVSRSADSPPALLPIPGMKSGLVGRAPPGDHWIWLFVPGPRSYPIPILYISTTPFEIQDLESLIVLPAGSFRSAEKLARSALSAAECPNDQGALKLLSTEVVEKSGKVENRCVLPQKKACELLIGLRNSPNIKWDIKELKPLDDFGRSIRCQVEVFFKGG